MVARESSQGRQRVPEQERDAARESVLHLAPLPPSALLLGLPTAEPSQKPGLQELAGDHSLLGLEQAGE